MEVPITQFRRHLFSLVEQAQDGAEVWVTHKGKRVRLVPENLPAHRLSRITPLQIYAPAAADAEDSAAKADALRAMEEAGKKDRVGM